MLSAQRIKLYTLYNIEHTAVIVNKGTYKSGGGCIAIRVNEQAVQLETGPYIGIQFGFKRPSWKLDPYILENGDAIQGTRSEYMSPFTVYVSISTNAESRYFNESKIRD